MPDDASILASIEGYISTNPEQKHAFILAYYGGSFTAIPKEGQIRLLTLAKEAMDKGRICGIRVSTRPDYLTPKHVDLLKQYGVDYVELGVQSTDAQVLSLAGRYYDKTVLQTSVENLTQAGIGYGFQMMVGLPGDNEEKLLRTTMELAHWRPGSLRIYPCLVLADTQLHEWYNQGSYQPLTVEEAVEWTKIPFTVFTNRNIPIIRMGLHAGASLQGPDALVAGPFHPAFGEMVVSAVYRDMLTDAIRTHGLAGKDILVKADKRRHSMIMGNRAFVKKALAQEHGVQVKLEEALADSLDLVVTWDTGQILLEMKAYLEHMEAMYAMKYLTRK